MIITRVGRRGQITLPRSVRKQLGIEEGDRIAFLTQGSKVLMQPLSQTLFDLRGSVPVKGPQDFDEIRKEAISNRAKKVLRHGE